MVAVVPLAIQAAPRAIICSPGRHMISGSAPANSALLLYFDDRAVGGGQSNEMGNYQIPLVIEPNIRHGAYALVIRMRENRRIVETLTCVVPDPNKPNPSPQSVQTTHTPNTPQPTNTIQVTATALAETQSPQIEDSYPCQVDQIKGNRNSMIYHMPKQRDYARTRENVECFNSEEEASAAGYRKAER